MSIQDLRSHKIFGLAIFDLSLSFIGVIILLGITFHVLFGVNTKMNYELGLSNKPISK